MAAKTPQDIYARHLSSSRGYPIWTPEPGSRLLSYRPDGLRIGDVGVLVPEDGHFDVFFNLCLPKDHPFHQATGVPDDFTPIELTDTDIKTVANAESAGQVLTATSVRIEECGAPVSEGLPPKASQSGVTRFTFNMSSSDGAVLVLPEGAERHDVRDSRPFFEQASRHAGAWYHFAEEHLGRIISHDSIYVVTGLHKARSWSVASYQNQEGNVDFQAYFMVGGASEGTRGLAAGYKWDTTRNMDWRAGPYDSPDTPNQSVFIRGFKIALRSAVQGEPQQWPTFQHDVSSNRRNSSGDSWLSNVWRGISNSIRVSSDSSESHERETSDGHIEVSHIPEILPVFHPSDVINRYILQKEPAAKVAILHDSTWGLMLDKNLLKPEELVRGEMLIKLISERYTIVSRDGVAHLESKSRFDIPLDVTTDDSPTPKAVAKELCDAESLSIVSESKYRCPDADEKAIGSADIHSIPSKFTAASDPASVRPIKIIVISDYICGFCYVCDKSLHDAIDASQDLPLRFDVEFRPFILLNLANPLGTKSAEVVYRNSYVVKKFGKEQAEIKLKALKELSQIAGLTIAEDSIVCGTLHAHRLSAKAYRDGGQEMQRKLNTFLFDACHSKDADISDEDVLVDAAVSVGLMNKEEATRFLRSTEYQDCVEKMVEAAGSHGITGVPFVIIDNKWAVNGLQAKECFMQIFHKLAHLPVTSTSVAGKPDAEKGPQVA